MTTVRDRRMMDELFEAGLSRSSTDDERAVLGVMMLAATSSGIPADIRVRLRPRDATKGSGEHHFYFPPHQHIWKTIIALMDDGEPHDAISVAARMPAELLQRVGGYPYLSGCVDMVPTVANGTAYARDLAGATLLRDVSEAATQGIQRAIGSSLHAAVDTYKDIRAALDAVEVPELGDGPVDWNTLTAEINDELERQEAIALNPELVVGEFSTGWQEVDKLLMPVVPGAMIVIAGRPGMAKTTTVTNIVKHLALERRLPVLFFSLEMSPLEIGLKILCSRAKLRSDDIKHGTLGDEGWAQAARYQGLDADAPLDIDGTAGVSTDYIDRELAAFVLRHGRPPVAFVVDHIGLLEEHSGRDDREKMDKISRSLKKLAKKYGTVCLALSQLNRGPEQRQGGIPQLSDLRRSGAIEQDADVVALLHREDYYDKESPRPGEMDFIIAKHRNGATATITLIAQLHMSRVVSAP